MKYEAKRSQFMKLEMIYKTNMFWGDFHFDPDEIRALIIAQEFLCKYFHPITGEENDQGLFAFLPLRTSSRTRSFCSFPYHLTRFFLN